MGLTFRTWRAASGLLATALRCNHGRQAGAVALQFQQQQHWLHTVRMILIKDHEHLGKKGDVVSVRAGFARNDLYPNRWAVYATPANQARLAPQEQSEPEASSSGSSAAGEAAAGPVPPASELEHVLRLLSTNTLMARRHFNWRLEDQPMLRAVTKMHIQQLVAEQLHVDLPRELLLMDKSIQQFGDFKVPLNLVDAQGKQVELTLRVQKTRRRM